MSSRLSHRSGESGESPCARGRNGGCRRGARPRLAPRPGARLALALALAWLLAMAVGCSDEKGSDDAEAAVAGATDEATGDATGSSFRWPEDAGHPRLSIEAVGPGIEGTIEIELMPDLAPKSVAHVLDLAREGFYDGTTFHRVIPGFMIQGGDPYSRDRDPSNDGQGGMGERIEDELSEAPFLRGVVALANRSRPDSSGSQLFIMHDENRALDGHYNVIGRVEAGMDVVDAIAEVETDTVGRWGPKDRPIENVVMARVQASGPEPGSEAHLAQDGVPTSER